MIPVASKLVELDVGRWAFGVFCFKCLVRALSVRRFSARS